MLKLVAKGCEMRGSERDWGEKKGGERGRQETRMETGAVEKVQAQG